jgi:perosamine synthetase
MAEKPISMYDRKLDEKAIMAALSKVVRSGKLTRHNPVVGEFEEAFAEWLGVQYAVACSSGTAALHLILAAIGIGPGDVVAVPELTYIATANAARYVGAVVLPVDVSPYTLNMQHTGYGSPDCTILTHLLGADANTVREELLIEDACEAIGTVLTDGRRAGTAGHAGAFSFYWNKQITCGEGGMVVTRHKALAERVRWLADQAGDSNYWHETVGFNYRMTAMQAAIGLSQMPQIDAIVAAHKRNYRQYEVGLGITQGPRFGEHGGWAYAYRPPGRARRTSAQYLLKQHNIECRPMFPPISEQGPWRNCRPNRNPYAVAASRSTVMLPCHPMLTRQDVDRIINILKEGEENVRGEDRAERQDGEHSEAEGPRECPTGSQERA